MKQQKQTSITVFYSYAPIDREWRDQFAIHLSQLKRDGLIEELYDDLILAGEERSPEQDRMLRSAQIILLLISADFLASDACYQIEMQHALERHRRGEARVVPIIVRPCDWQHSPFAHLQCLPRNTKPITTWVNQDDAFVMIVQELRKIIAQQYTFDPPLTTVQRQNRTRLLQQVRKIWIDGLLDQSLHYAAWIDLYLKDQPDVLENPWRFQVQELNQLPRALPVDTNIIEVYDDADGKLLILGEPGSGKTTLLLQLARTLLDRAEVDERQPLPVVFNLSSWAQQRTPLATWLIEELNTKYQVLQKIGKFWIDTDQVLPLLDGLDEVAEKDRVECIRAINAFQQVHDSVPLVVCSRTTDYLNQAEKVAVQKAVLIQPLTVQQIDTYLEKAGEQLEGLQVVLRDDPNFREFANTPLMLSILTLTYHGKSAKDIANEVSIEARRHQVFAAYVQRMFQRRSIETRYSSEQTEHWLTWLAQQMMLQSQTEFHIERLQPDWLSQQHLIIRYQRLAVRFIRLLLGGLFGLLVAGLLLGPVIRLPDSIAYTFVGGVIGFFTSGGKRTVYPPTSNKYLCNLLWQRIVSNKHLKNGFIGFMIGGVVFGTVVWLVYGANFKLYYKLGYRLDITLLIALVGGIVYGLVGVLVGFLVPSGEIQVMPNEYLRWSWKNAWQRLSNLKILIYGLSIGLSFGAIDALGYGVIYSGTLGLRLGIGYFLFYGLSCWLLMGLFGGWSNNLLDVKNLTRPNQGIWNSARNSLKIGLASIFVSGSIFGAVTYLLFVYIKSNVFQYYEASVYGVFYGLLFGILIGLVISLFNGGIACIQHLLLRVLLWQARYTPWNYPRFLDSASERILLRKVGGGYIFVHRFLLEYFATLDESTSAENTSSTGKRGKESH
jgi:Cdc6-like AAA superfamily ATPase